MHPLVQNKYNVVKFPRFAILRRVIPTAKLERLILNHHLPPHTAPAPEPIACAQQCLQSTFTVHGWPTETYQSSGQRGQGAHRQARFKMRQEHRSLRPRSRLGGRGALASFVHLRKRLHSRLAGSMLRICCQKSLTRSLPRSRMSDTATCSHIRSKMTTFPYRPHVLIVIAFYKRGIS